MIAGGEAMSSGVSLLSCSRENDNRLFCSDNYDNFRALLGEAECAIAAATPAATITLLDLVKELAVSCRCLALSV
jgi:hypothetical protein